MTPPAQCRPLPSHAQGLPAPSECPALIRDPVFIPSSQTSSRNAASMYLCSLHNRVNERLGKPEFDCSTLPEIYDCGCGDPSASADSTAPATTGPNNASGPHLARA